MSGLSVAKSLGGGGGRYTVVDESGDGFTFMSETDISYSGDSSEDDFAAYVEYRRAADASLMDAMTVIHQDIQILTAVAVIAFALVIGKWILSSFFGW